MNQNFYLWWEYILFCPDITFYGWLGIQTCPGSHSNHYMSSLCRLCNLLSISMIDFFSSLSSDIARQNFNWAAYLRTTKSIAAPKTLFVNQPATVRIVLSVRMWCVTSCAKVNAEPGNHLLFNDSVSLLSLLLNGWFTICVPFSFLPVWTLADCLNFDALDKCLPTSAAITNIFSWWKCVSGMIKYNKTRCM